METSCTVIPELTVWLPNHGELRLIGNHHGRYRQFAADCSPQPWGTQIDWKHKKPEWATPEVGTPQPWGTQIDWKPFAESVAGAPPNPLPNHGELRLIGNHKSPPPKNQSLSPQPWGTQIDWKLQWRQAIYLCYFACAAPQPWGTQIDWKRSRKYK